LPRLVEQLTLDPAVPPDADRVVSMLASLFGSGRGPRDAPSTGDPARLARVRRARRVPRPRPACSASELPAEIEHARDAVLPWQMSALREQAAPAPWALLDDVRIPVPDTAFPGPWAAAWRASLESRSSDAREQRHALARELAEGWETRMQEAFGRGARARARGRAP
jgi:hypothetical protein